MRLVAGLLVALAALAACGEERPAPGASSGPPTVSGADAASASFAPADAGAPVAADAADRGRVDAGADGAPVAASLDARGAARADAGAPPPGGCVPGQQAPCTCAGPTGMSLPGVKVCLEAAGTYSQCGCAFAHPYTGPTCQGGKVECPALVGQPTQYAGKHCCTAAGKCGLTNPDAFGDLCVERGAQPAGQPTTACGETLIPFIEVEDCCRPDGSCGLWFRQGDNWDDLGCVERVELASMLKKSGLLGLFLFIAGKGDVLDGIKPARCAYKGP